MRIRWCLATWMGVLAAGILASAAPAQVPGRPLGRPVVYNSGGIVRAVVVRVPAFTTIRMQTTVTVPDDGTATLGGYSQVSEGRTEYGPPVLGRVPYLSRAVRNVGTGREVTSGRVGVSVRIIDLREEEY